LPQRGHLQASPRSAASVTLAEGSSVMCAPLSSGFQTKKGGPAAALLNTPERFRAKWIPVRVKKTRQNKNLEPRF
jgi:hypothetical protein